MSEPAVVTADSVRTSPERAPFWDRAGIWVSALCMLHCLALPIAAILLPFAVQEALHEPAHVLFFTAAFPLALVAFVGGWRQHGRWLPGALGALGVTLLVVALTLHSLETVLSILGGLVLVGAHLLNHRHSESCSEECSGATC